MVVDTPPTSDVLQLPVEVIMEIFTLSVIPRPFFSSHLALHTTKSRHSLSFSRSHGASQVCRYWRTVALSTPQMWTDIPTFRMVDSHWKGERGWDASIIDELDVYLSRSRALPIHIFIDLWGTESIPESVLHKILSSFAREASRWETAVILFDQCHLPVLNHWIHLEMPLLQKLDFRIRVMFGYTGISDEELPIIASVPLNLKELVLDGYSQHSASGGVFKPGLESFTGLPYELECLAKAASTLKSCTFRGIHIRDMRLPEINHRIPFPSLNVLEVTEIRYSRLCVHYNDALHLATLFNYIDAPNLDKLVVDCGRTEMNGTQLLIGIFEAAIASSWKLTSLSLCIYDMSWILVVGICKILPTLRELAIESFPFSDMVESFQYDGFLPKLERLAIFVRVARASLSFLRHSAQGTQTLSVEAVKRPLSIEARFLSPHTCSEAYQVVLDLPTDHHGRKVHIEYGMLIGWRRFLAKQLVCCGAKSVTKFAALMSKRKKRKKPIKVQSLDFKNIGHVLRLLESIDFQFDDNILESRLIELLEALAALPDDLIPLEEADIRPQAARVASRLVERIRAHGRAWPLPWVLGEDGCSLRLEGV